MRRLLTIVTILLLSQFLSVASRAQDTILKSKTELVNLEISTIDSRGRPIRVEQSDLQIWEDKIKQDISHFREEDAPVSIAFVCDISGSMKEKMKALRAAVQRFGESSHPDDEYVLITFRDKSFNLGEQLGWNDLVNRLAFIRPLGRTAVFDGIMDGVAALKQSKLTRKVMILVSDGQDNASRATYRQVRETLKETDIRLFAIGTVDLQFIANQTSISRITGLPEIPPEAAGLEILAELSKLENGIFVLADSEQDLTIAAELIALELRKSFTIAYSPTNESQKREWRKIKIKCTKPGVTVVYRPGYFSQVK